MQSFQKERRNFVLSNGSGLRQAVSRINVAGTAEQFCPTRVLSRTALSQKAKATRPDTSPLHQQIAVSAFVF
jgi:hypothetical protein